MNEKWPFSKQVISTPGLIGHSSINPMPSVPGEQFMRSIDPPATGGGPGGAAAEAGPYPFDVDITGSGTIDCAVRIGVLNNIIPSNFYEIFSFADNVTRFLVLSATAENGGITGCSLSMEALSPPSIPVLQGAPPDDFELLLGVVVDAVWFRTIGNGSLFATPVEVFRTDRLTPTPGSLPYDIYYTWSITNV